MMTEQEEKDAIVKRMQLGWDLLFNQTRVIAMLPLEDWLERMSRADTLGPILDPTLWMKAHEKMDKIRTIIEAALVLKKAVLKLQSEVGDEHG